MQNTISDRRKGMGPECLDASITLCANYDLWISEASAMIQIVLNEELGAAKKKSHLDLITMRVTLVRLCSS